MTAAGAMPGSRDRLAYALFFAAVLHAVVILGVAFDAPEEADYLAQANQQGAGNVEEQVDPEFADSPPAPDTDVTLKRGLTLQFAAARPAASEDRLLTPDSRVRLREQEASEQGEAVSEAPPPGGVLRVTGDGRREYFIAVNTRESEFAEYLAGWKARMERLGTLNFPTAARRQGLEGQPVLEVALAADGQLEDVRIVRTSGHPELDGAALDLVRLGSPFDPFPAQVRESYDVLRFAYEWRFMDGRVSGSGVYSPPRP